MLVVAACNPSYILPLGPLATPQGDGLYKATSVSGFAFMARRWARGDAERFCKERGKVMSLVRERARSFLLEERVSVWFRCVAAEDR